MIVTVPVIAMVQVRQKWPAEMQDLKQHLQTVSELAHYPKKWDWGSQQVELGFAKQESEAAETGIVGVEAESLVTR